MVSTSTGAAGASRWRPLLTGLVWIVLIAAAFGGWQVWKIFLEPHARMLVVEAEADPLTTARSDAERVLVAMEIEFRAPDTGAALLRLAPSPEIPRRAELTVRGRALQELVDEGRLEAWVHLGSSEGTLGDGRISAPLAPPRMQDEGLVYRLGLDDAVRLLGRRLQTEIAVRDQVGLQVESLNSERVGELVEDERRPGVYRVGVGLSQVMRAEEDQSELVIGVRNAQGREGRLRIPSRWFQGSATGDRVVAIEWTTEAIEAPQVAEVVPATPAPDTRTPVKSDPRVATPPRPDPARIEVERLARVTQLTSEVREALGRADLDAAEGLLTQLEGVEGSRSEANALRTELEAARVEARALAQRSAARDAVESALAAGDFDAAEAALSPATRAGIEQVQVQQWKDAIARGREAAAEQAAAAALERDRQGVRDAIAQLESAFDRLDVDLLYRVFPDFPAPRRDQTNNWNQYTSQDMSLEVIGTVSLDGDRATVRCRRTILYELKLGRHDPLAPDEVSIELQRAGSDWRIVRWERIR